MPSDKAKYGKWGGWHDPDGLHDKLKEIVKSDGGNVNFVYRKLVQMYVDNPNIITKKKL